MQALFDKCDHLTYANVTVCHMHCLVHGQPGSILTKLTPRIEVFVSFLLLSLFFFIYSISICLNLFYVYFVFFSLLFSVFGIL